MATKKVEVSFKIRPEVFISVKEFASIEDIPVDDVIELALSKYLDIDVEEDSELD